MAAKSITGVFLTVLFQYGICNNCNDFCIFLWQPICGSDGNTYSNDCELKNMNCRLGGGLTKASDGACQVVSLTSDAVSKRLAVIKCDFECTDEWFPVCGSDQRTYSNGCELSRANCRTAGAIKPYSKGPCDPIAASKRDASLCPDICPMNYDPLCASDGNTYSNGCGLSVERCHTNGTVHFVHRGPCASGPTKREAVRQCPEVCPMIYDPVCGSDGKTYGNGCSLQIAVCRSNGAVAYVSKGGCLSVSRRDQ